MLNKHLIQEYNKLYLWYYSGQRWASFESFLHPKIYMFPGLNIVHFEEQTIRTKVSDVGCWAPHIPSSQPPLLPLTSPLPSPSPQRCKAQ